jgi:hypothetical protein
VFLRDKWFEYTSLTETHHRLCLHLALDARCLKLDLSVTLLKPSHFLPLTILLLQHTSYSYLFLFVLSYTCWVLDEMNHIHFRTEQRRSVWQAFKNQSLLFIAHLVLRNKLFFMLHGQAVVRLLCDVVLDRGLMIA